MKDGWLTQTYDYEPPRSGQFCTGVILKLETRGITVDIGLKRDGFIPQSDLEQVEEETIAELEPGQEIKVRMVQPARLDDNHILSLYQARQAEDWIRAQKFLESNEIWWGKAIGYNRGGLLVKFGQLEAFVPASHLSAKYRQNLSGTPHKARWDEYVGQELPLQVIEVNHEKNRLLFSEKLATKQIRQQSLERFLVEFMEGEVRQGTVHHLCDFGAFVDLGGADGLIHNSELRWRKVRHPSEVLRVGDEIEVYILRLDHERKRISLSLKRLQPNPWTLVQQTLTVEQLISGTVTSIASFASFGVFVRLDIGVEGLVHISELADPQPQNPREIVKLGDQLVLRILRIDPYRQRMGLSLKRVSKAERENWLAQQGPE
jgi:small subunit ribosomal protein S1